MKKLSILILFALPLLFSGKSFAQLRIAYVDSRTVMAQLPDAQDAQKKLDVVVQEWNDELLKMQKAVRDRQADFEKKKLIMSESRRLEEEKEISSLEAGVSDYKQKKFGVAGELFQKQEEIMKPIQNKVFITIKQVAVEQKYDYVFDRSSDLLFLYAKEEYDITKLVIDKLK